jgi:hypothetical protein
MVATQSRPSGNAEYKGTLKLSRLFRCHTSPIVRVLALTDGIFKGVDLMFRILVILACLSVVAPAVDASAQSEGQRSPRGRGQRIKSLDADGDGRIARSERKRKPDEVFDRLDANSDGFLSVEELKAKARRRGVRQKGRRLAALDKNNDGIISRDEWTGPASRFDRLDLDKNGSLSAEEIRNRRRKR